MLQRLLEADEGSFESLRAVLVGGGPIPAGLLERAAAVGLPVLPTYGMTESFGQVATLKPGSPLSPRAHPLPGVALRIESDGRISVKGPQISPGYLGEPDREDEWFATSDLGSLDADGALTVEGRVDSVIVSGGENVDPVWLEDRLRRLSGIEDVIVVGVPDEIWGQKVLAIYSGAREPGDIPGALADLPGHLRPKAWLRVDAVPRTPIGKPDRQAALRLALRGE
jgi:O-succinylbenzoic acid--CoA ligase